MKYFADKLENEVGKWDGLNVQWKNGSVLVPLENLKEIYFCDDEKKDNWIF
jgi:hypothetical protein